jgi:hypothetical protein
MGPLDVAGRVRSIDLEPMVRAAVRGGQPEVWNTAPKCSNS